MQNDILVCVKMLFAVKIQSHTMADFLKYCFFESKMLVAKLWIADNNWKARCWIQSFEELTKTEKLHLLQSFLGACSRCLIWKQHFGFCFLLCVCKWAHNLVIGNKTQVIQNHRCSALKDAMHPIINWLQQESSHHGTMLGFTMTGNSWQSFWRWASSARKSSLFHKLDMGFWSGPKQKLYKTWFGAKAKVAETLWWLQSSMSWHHDICTNKLESIKFWSSLGSFKLLESTIHTLGGEMQWPCGCQSFCPSFLVSQLRVPCVHAWFCPKKLAKSYYPNWLATSYIWYTNGPNSGPCWICGLNPFSPTILEPWCFHSKVLHTACSACTIGSCANRSRIGRNLFCNAKSKANDGLPLHGSSLLLPPLCLAMAFVGVLAPALGHCGPPGFCGNCQWPGLAASHIGSPWLVASWFKAGWFKALKATEMFGPKDMNKTMVLIRVGPVW